MQGRELRIDGQIAYQFFETDRIGFGKQGPNHTVPVVVAIFRNRLERIERGIKASRAIDFPRRVEYLGQSGIGILPDILDGSSLFCVGSV
ncbi:MAG: hypothetical protein SAMD01599839_15200 [Rectinema sp.]